MYDSATKAALPEGGVATVVHHGDGQRIQWTVKGVDPATVDMAREAARKNGMKLGAWVSLALQKAATPEEDSNAAALIEEKIDTVSGKLSDEIRLLSERCVNMSAELQNIHTALFRVVLDEKSK